MKINGEKDAAFRTNAQSTKSYTIKAGAKAFAVLSSQLYKNPIRAIIRELSCNAIDAHRQADNPEPFNVYFPNAFSDEFTIEDFGVGMSTETMDKVYHTYFESTKEDNDDDIGGFGIGSKTPFSYTSLFNVRSVRDGIETISMSFLNHEQVPQYNLVSTGKTSDPNGTRVSFTVKPQDFERFYREAINVFAFLPQLPNVKSGLDELLKHIPSDRDATWEDFEAIRAKISAGVVEGEIENFVSRVIGGACLLMGGVPYRLDVAEAFKNDAAMQEDYTKIRRIRDFYNTKMVIPVRIGDVVVQPSREELSYDARTIATIKHYFGQSFTAFFDALLDAKTPYQRFHVCREHAAQVSFLDDYGFHLGRMQVNKPDFGGMMKVLGSSVVTEAVQKIILRTIGEACAFNNDFNGLTEAKKIAKKLKLDEALTSHNYTVPIVSITKGNRIKVAGDHILSVCYSWKKDYVVNEIIKMLDDDGLMSCSREYWAANMSPEQVNTNRKKWTNTRRAVVERTETLWRNNVDAVEVLNPERFAVLKKFGFDVSNLKMFDAVQPHEYKLARTISRSAELRESRVRILGNSGNALKGSDPGTYGKADDNKAPDAKIYWAILDTFERRGYYGEDKVLFLSDNHFSSKYSKESAKKCGLPNGFLSALESVLEKIDTDHPLKKCVIVGLNYLDIKKAKLYEDMGSSFQKLMIEVALKYYPTILEKYKLKSLAKNLRLYTAIRKQVTKKLGGLGVTEYEKMLEAVGDESSNSSELDNLAKVLRGLNDFGYKQLVGKQQPESDDEGPSERLKKAMFKAYPLLEYAERAQCYGSDNNKIHSNFADYIIERDGLPFAESPRLVAQGVLDDGLKASA